MTTKEAEQLYLAQHLNQWADRGWAVYNPHDKPIDALPVIYGFNNGGGPGWMSACLIAEDGTPLGGHCCSHEGYMPADLGVLEGSRPDRHEYFRKHYPDGYRMEFVSGSEVKGHEKLMAAINVANSKPEEDEASTG